MIGILSKETTVLTDFVSCFLPEFWYFDMPFQCSQPLPSRIDPAIGCRLHTSIGLNSLCLQKDMAEANFPVSLTVSGHYPRNW